MEGSTVYQFLGRYFVPYVDIGTFKQRLAQELKYNVEHFQIEKAYEEITEENVANKAILDKILFESILYGDLKNIFIETLDNNPNLDVHTFKKRMEVFIEKINYGKLTNELEKYMSPDGFLLMESISTTQPGTFFLAGFDFKTNSEDKLSSVRMLFSSVVPLVEPPNVGYFLSGVDIDLEKQTCLIMFKNITNEIDNDFEEVT
ncbi:hypothetical protein [Bacillus smithii]|uniref:hypothetical protein n=1 Tax=Bacillus smithii TaxID=1479 RepID=UPI003D1A39EE